MEEHGKQKILEALASISARLKEFADAEEDADTISKFDSLEYQVNHLYYFVEETM